MNFLNSISNTITRPWREEVPFPQLVLAIVLFAILAWAVYDALRIMSSWLAQAANRA